MGDPIRRATEEPAMTRVRLASALLLVVGLAFVLSWVSNRLLYIGPLDRATFGVLVVLPLWAAAPLVAGFAWRGFDSSGRTRLAALGGAVVGFASAVLLWLDAAAPKVGCTPTHAPIELVPPALAVGAVLGGGFVVACRLAGGEIAAGRIGRGAIYGAVVQLVVIPAALTLYSLFFFGMCQRP